MNFLRLSQLMDCFIQTSNDVFGDILGQRYLPHHNSNPGLDCPLVNYYLQIFFIHKAQNEYENVKAGEL